jgi:hypothetical protein
LEIFGYRIGYKYPLIYILPVSGFQIVLLTQKGVPDYVSGPFPDAAKVELDF